MVIEKLDLSKQDKTYYKATKEPLIRDLDPYYYLTVEGQSAPDDQVFLNAIEKLYSVAYGVKFLLKGEDMDFVVPKMEGFWFVEGGVERQAEFAATPKDKWCWKIMIRMPDFVEENHYKRASKNVSLKKGINIEEVQFELINEGKCAQILHLGSYDEEASTIEKLHQFIWDNDLQIANYHHEIYLSDPRRTPEDRLKTIIRYAVK